MAPRFVPALKRIAPLLSVVVLAVMAWQGCLAARDTFEFNDVTADLGLPRVLALDRAAGRHDRRRRRGARHGIARGTTRSAMSIAAIGFLGVAGLLLLIFAARADRGRARASGLLGYAAIDGWSPALKMFGLVPYQLASAYSLSVIPLFILMGAVASRANMATELFQACNAVFSGMRGALANATIGACALFGAICGSSIATAATFSKVAIPEMRRHGYEPAFAAGAVASAGTLDVLIPPSVLTAIYAIVAEQSLVKLYAAALIPGLRARRALCHGGVARGVAASRRGSPRSRRCRFMPRLRASVGMWKLGVLFFFAVFGIYLGWFSPTEAAAVAAFVAILIAFATGAMGWRDLIDALLETVYTTATIFFIVVGAFIFSRFIVLTQFPDRAGEVGRR